jgi:hypothetical protein
MEAFPDATFLAKAGPWVMLLHPGLKHRGNSCLAKAERPDAEYPGLKDRGNSCWAEAHREFIPLVYKRKRPNTFGSAFFI